MVGTGGFSNLGSLCKKVWMPLSREFACKKFYTLEDMAQMRHGYAHDVVGDFKFTLQI